MEEDNLFEIILEAIRTGDGSKLPPGYRLELISLGGPVSTGYGGLTHTRPGYAVYDPNGFLIAANNPREEVYKHVLRLNLHDPGENFLNDLTFDIATLGRYGAAKAGYLAAKTMLTIGEGLTPHAYFRAGLPLANATARVGLNPKMVGLYADGIYTIPAGLSANYAIRTWNNPKASMDDKIFGTADAVLWNLPMLEAYKNAGSTLWGGARRGYKYINGKFRPIYDGTMDFGYLGNQPIESVNLSYPVGPLAGEEGWYLGQFREPVKLPPEGTAVTYEGKSYKLGETINGETKLIGEDGNNIVVSAEVAGRLPSEALPTRVVGVSKGYGQPIDIVSTTGNGTNVVYSAESQLPKELNYGYVVNPEERRALIMLDREAPVHLNVVKEKVLPVEVKTNNPNVKTEYGDPLTLAPEVGTTIYDELTGSTYNVEGIDPLGYIQVVNVLTGTNGRIHPNDIGFYRPVQNVVTPPPFAELDPTAPFRDPTLQLAPVTNPKNHVLNSPYVIRPANEPAGEPVSNVKEPTTQGWGYEYEYMDSPTLGMISNDSYASTGEFGETPPPFKGPRDEEAVLERVNEDGGGSGNSGGSGNNNQSNNSIDPLIQQVFGEEITGTPMTANINTPKFWWVTPREIRGININGLFFPAQGASGNDVNFLVNNKLYPRNFYEELPNGVSYEYGSRRFGQWGGSGEWFPGMLFRNLFSRGTDLSVRTTLAEPKGWWGGFGWPLIRNFILPSTIPVGAGFGIYYGTKKVPGAETLNNVTIGKDTIPMMSPIDDYPLGRIEDSDTSLIDLNPNETTISLSTNENMYDLPLDSVVNFNGDLLAIYDKFVNVAKSDTTNTITLLYIDRLVPLSQSTNKEDLEAFIQLLLEWESKYGNLYDSQGNPKR